MHSKKVGLAHIQGLVAALVDSFHLLHSSSDFAQEDFGYAFAKELRARAHGIREVADAFRSGVKQGREIVGYYENQRWRRDGQSTRS